MSSDAECYTRWLARCNPPIAFDPAFMRVARGEKENQTEGPRGIYCPRDYKTVVLGQEATTD